MSRKITTLINQQNNELKVFEVSPLLFILSFAISIFSLGTSIFLLALYQYVLPARSEVTLVVLFLITLMATIYQSFFEIRRDELLDAIAIHRKKSVVDQMVVNGIYLARGGKTHQSNMMLKLMEESNAI